MESNNSINYITYYLGNPEDILRSTRIKLFYRNDLTPTLSNIIEVHENIINNPEYNESGFNGFIIRESEDDFFEITLRNDLSKGVFNSIIYYTSSSPNPVGFTNFFKNQSLIIDEKARIKSIKLHTSFKINNLTPDSNNESLIINSLVDLRTYMNEDTEISSKLVKNRDRKESYASVGSVFDYYSKTSNLGLNYKRYTSSLTDLISDQSFVLMTDSLCLCGGKTGNIYKFSLSSGIELNTYDVVYTKFFVGKYKEEISLFEWSDEKETRGTFRVISLTRKNRFGLPIVLVEKHRIEENLSEDLEVEMMSGDYIIFTNKNTNDQYLYNLTEKSPSLKISSEYGITYNSWGDDNRIQYYLKKSPSILEVFPKESTLYTEFLSLPINKELYSSLFFVKRVGSWFIFRSTSSNQGKETLIYSSRYGCIYFDSEEENNIIPVNDKTLLVQEKQLSGDYKFSFYFTKPARPVYSNRYSENNGLGLEVNNKIEFLSTNKSMTEEDILKKKILIDGLRHSPIRSYEFSKSMKFISAYSGILFYVEEIDGVQKIFYL